jgi:hypothetical protein
MGVTKVTKKTAYTWFNALLFKVLSTTSNLKSTIGRVLMKRATLFISVASLALGASSAAMSSEIYKWVDDEGGLHYQDRPTEEQAAELMDIDSRATDNAAINEQTQARLEAKAVAAQVEAEAPAEMTWQEKKAEQQQRQRQCDSFRDQRDTYLRSRALYTEDANGNRIYQDEAERQATMNRIDTQIKEYCGA